MHRDSRTEGNIARVPQCGWRRCIAVRMKRNATPRTGIHSALSACPLPTKGSRTGPPRMQQTEFAGEYGRRGIHRAWYNTEGGLHRTAGPAMEEWTVLPDCGHMLSRQGWYSEGSLHREGRPAWRRWHVAGDCTWALEIEEWWRHSRGHRVGGPSFRCWTVGPDGTRTLEWEECGS